MRSSPGTGMERRGNDWSDRRGRGRGLRWRAGRRGTGGPEPRPDHDGRFNVRPRESPGRESRSWFCRHQNLLGNSPPGSFSRIKKVPLSLPEAADLETQSGCVRFCQKRTEPREFRPPGNTRVPIRRWSVAAIRRCRARRLLDSILFTSTTRIVFFPMFRQSGPLVK